MVADMIRVHMDRPERADKVFENVVSLLGKMAKAARREALGGGE